MAALAITLSLPRHSGSSAPRRSAQGNLKPIDGSPHGLDRAENTPVAPNLEQIVRQTDQTPFAPDVLQAAQQEAAEPSRFFALAKHGFRNDLAPGVPRLPCRRPDFRCQALLHRAGPLWGFGLRPMGLLAPSGDVWIASSGLSRLHGRLTVRAIIHGRRDGVGEAQLVLSVLNTRLGQIGQRRLGDRLSLLFVMRGIGHITGSNDRTRPVHTRLGIAAVLPPLVVGPHA